MFKAIAATIQSGPALVVVQDQVQLDLVKQAAGQDTLRYGSVQ